MRNCIYYTATMSNFIGILRNVTPDDRVNRNYLIKMWFMKSESYAVFLRSVEAYSLPSGHIASSPVIKTSPSCFDFDQLLHCSSFSVYQSLPSVAFFLCIKLYMSVTFRFLSCNIFNYGRIIN